MDIEQWRQAWGQHWRRLKYRGRRLFQRTSQLAITVARHPLRLVERVPAGPLRKSALFALFVLICFVPYLLRPISVKLAAFVQIFWSLAVMGVGLSIALVHFLVEKEQDALANGLLSEFRKRYSEVPIARYLSFEKLVDFGTLLVACGGMILAFGFLSQGIFDLGFKSWYLVSAEPGIWTWLLYAVGSVFRALDIFDVFASVGAGSIMAKGAVTGLLVFVFKAVFDLVLLAKIRDWWSKRGLVLDAIPALNHDETRKRAEETLRRCRKYAIPHLVDAFHNANKVPARRSALRLLHELEYRELVPLLLLAQESREEELRKEAASLLGKVAAKETQEVALIGLERALGDGSAEVRAAAAGELAIPEARQRVVPLLLKALKDPAGVVRERAAGAFKSLRAPESRSLLIDALKDKEANVRKEAVAALAQFEDEIFTALAPMLDDPNKDVRAAMVEAVAGQLEKEPELAVVTLIDALKDDEESIRVSIVEQLRFHQDPTVIAPLGELLASDRSSEVRRAAAETLGYLESKAAIPALRKALNDRHYLVRCAVIEALGDLRARGAVGEIVALLEDGDRDVRKQAASSLGALKVKEPHVLDALEQGLQDTDRTVRAACVEALSELTDGKSPALATALADEHAAVRTEAIQALASPISDEFVPPLVAMLEDKTEDLDVRKAAIDAISFYYADNWPQIEAQVMPLLPGLLDDDDLSLREATISAIGSVGFAGAHALIIPCLQREESDLRVAAAQALSFIEAPEALAALIDALRDDNVRVRAEAAEAIGEFAERGPVPEAVAPLLSALREDDQEVRKNAALALAQVDAEEALQALLDAMVAEDDQVRYAAAEALGVRHSDKDPQDPQIQRGCEALRVAIKDKSDDVRQAAAEALGYTDDPRNVEVLCGLLDKDASDWVRYAAAHSLGEIKSKSAIPALEKALVRDDDEWVRGEAAETLGQLQATSALPALQQALIDEREPWTRQHIVKALAEFDDPQSQKHLAEALLQEKSLDVRKVMVDVFEELGLSAHEDILRQAMEQESDARLRRKMQNLWLDWLVG